MQTRSLPCPTAEAVHEGGPRLASGARPGAWNGGPCPFLSSLTAAGATLGIGGEDITGAVGSLFGGEGGCDATAPQGNWSNLDMEWSASRASDAAEALKARAGQDPDVAKSLKAWYQNHQPLGGNCPLSTLDEHVNVVVWAAAGGWGGAGSGLNPGEEKARRIVESARSSGSIPTSTTATGTSSTDGEKGAGERLLDTALRILTGSSDLSAVEKRAERTVGGAEAGSKTPTSTETGFGTADMALAVGAALVLALLVANFAT